MSNTPVIGVLALQGDVREHLIALAAVDAVARPVRRPEELAEMWSAVTRRDGAAFLHNAAGFVAEHHRQAQRWDLAAIARDLDGSVALYVGGSDEDPYEHRQIPATRERVPPAEVLTFPGGHLTTSEHPDLLATAIREIAARHGVGTPATAHR